MAKAQNKPSGAGIGDIVIDQKPRPLPVPEPYRTYKEFDNGFTAVEFRMPFKPEEAWKEVYNVLVKWQTVNCIDKKIHKKKVEYEVIDGKGKPKKEYIVYISCKLKPHVNVEELQQSLSRNVKVKFNIDMNDDKAKKPTPRKKAALVAEAIEEPIEVIGHAGNS